MTHPDIKNKALRQAYANELFILRRSLRGQRVSRDWLDGVKLGLETAFRRASFLLLTTAGQ